MADNWLGSFAVALGFEVNTAQLNTAKKSIADYEAAVTAAEKRIEDARWAGAKSEQEIAKLTRETNLKEAKDALAAAQQREKAEAEQLKKREQHAKEFVSAWNRMALAATAAATAISYAVTTVTRSFDNLGFVSQRTGASVQALNSLSYAFKQVGGTSDQAVGAVESFAKALRENSGVKSYVQSLGVDMAADTAQQLLQTVEKLNTHPYDVGFREAGLAGISEENYNLISRQLAQIKAYRAEYDAMTKSLGVNSKDATDASMAFQRSLSRLQATASALTDKLLVSLAPALKAIVDRFQDWIRSNPEKVERIMDGISRAVVWFAEKLGAMVTWFAGSEGEAFMRRWDAFSDKVGTIARAFESIFGTLKKIANATHLSAILGGYDKIITGILGGPAAFEKANGGAGVVVTPGATAGPSVDNRSLYERYAPTILGGKPDPNAPERTGLRRRGDRNAEAIGRLNPRAAEGPGRYRPEYKLGDADLSQRTADIIAGEAIRRNPESIDAVINNMLNRVGSKGWGPSRNLQEVATAPGQYEAAWKGSGASPSETEFIRSRIRAIASGGIPDNTNGSNAFRASGYRGPWYQRNANAPVVGGNRFGYESSVPNGPYAPYSTPKDVPPPKPADASTFPIKVTAPKIEIRGGEGASAAPQIHVPGLPRMMQMPDFKATDYIKSDPSVSSSVQNSSVTNNRAVHQTFNQTTTVNGAESPRQAARIMESAFGNMHNLALRNAQSATV